MLKERIDYLCHKKDMSRKELTDGLVTQAHFSNILAGRYPLPDDLAEPMAERLGVSPGYLLHTDDQDDDVLQQADQIVEQLSVQASALEEQQVNDLPDRHDTLTVELTTALMKATYYQQLNDQDAYAYLHQSYLNFYLERFGRPDEAMLPLPLTKAMLFYKIQSARSRQKYHDVLTQVEQWLKLLPEQGETWLTAQQIRMEACVHTRQFEHAKQTFEKITSYIYEQRLFHRLSGLYVLYSGYCHSMQQPHEALLALSMAEAHLVYAQHQSDTWSAIMNNRILMLTMAGELVQAEQEVDRFGSMVDTQTVEVQQQMAPVLLVYRCEIELARQDWAALVQRLEQLRALTLTEDQQMAARFYSSQQALAHGQADLFIEEATACLPYFEQIRHQERLNILYEGLAVMSEEQRRYKDAAWYYRKLVYLLRHA
ncbi:helix-turn-helix domain-containing protein [Paenibacillus shenyangensis]|uniref:helix-turn-helix domain-containing protein n=1 Tax=Paenibacillus sp. A9 TaxID=1284352 RepID=UPI000381DB9D|nr:helix-turn-helix transcriptional regulator [Paenibacillus sp. A9]